ncbi:MAG TPA: helix-turn-helix domain-containing protein [Candidatus Saccharimonadales bacterium]
MNVLATRETQAKRILNFLKAEGKATNVELNRMGIFRYGARIKELRDDGYRIVSVHVKDGLWEFVYKGHEDDEPNHKEWDAGR